MNRPVWVIPKTIEVLNPDDQLSCIRSLHTTSPNTRELMNETAKPPKFERTPEQKAEECRIREQHRLSPVREVPQDAISGEDVTQLLMLAAAIRREREANGMTIEQLASIAKVDAGVLARFESGQSFNPPVSVLMRLARSLNRTLSVSLTGE